MDAEKFGREMAIQNDYLRRQLVALSSKPNRVRKQFVAHEIRCSNCDDVIIEFVRLDPYSVIRYRNSEMDSSPPKRDDYPTMAAFAQARAERKRSVRLDKNWKFTPIPNEPSLNENRQLLATSCRCASDRIFTVAGIRDRAKAGAKSTASPPTRH